MMEEIDPVIHYSFYKELIGHTSTLHTINFSPNGQLLASASEESALKIWNVSDGELVKNLVGHQYAINEVAWSTDNSLLASASDDNTLKIWDVQRGRPLMTLEGHTGYVSSCKFNTQMTLVVSGSYDETIRVWDRRTGNTVLTTPSQTDPIGCVLFNKEGSRIISGNFNGICSIWEMAGAKCLQNIEASYAPITNLKLMPDENWLLTAAIDDCLRLWHIQDLALKMYRGHKNQIHHIAIDYLVAPTGATYLVSGSEDKLVYVWNMESQAVNQTLAGHNRVVVCVACHPSEEVIASSTLEADDDGRFPIKIWKNTV